MVKSTPDLRAEFLINPEIAFFNHGSFGACPRPVFEAYQQWQRELEFQPIEFLGRRYNSLMDEARQVLAGYIGAEVADLIFVPNTTVGINMVARSLTLEPGDEVLSTDHEYGAMDITWRFICEKAGATYRTAKVPLPMSSVDDVIEAIWSQVTPHTRVLFFSHITSPTALIFPVEELCCRARERGIITVIDGAHVPGQIPLDCTAIDADFYTGNCHKWLCAPKGAAFLHVKKAQQALVVPAVISWGCLDDASFAKRNQWQGTRDIAAYLSIPAAIDYQQARNWPEVRKRCHLLVKETVERIQALTGLPLLSPLSGEWVAQMASIALPVVDKEELKAKLLDEYLIEVPIFEWNGGTNMRLSIQGYNGQDDVDRLVLALDDLLQRKNTKT
jgi:isopenicillin-N epimerase